MRRYLFQREAVQRPIAIALALSFCILAAAPLLNAFAIASSRDLPPCCRKNGRHHCAMRMLQGHSEQDARSSMAAPAERCPIFPRAVVPVVMPVHFLAPPGRAALESLLRGHPANAAQIEARLRISFARSRQKRGPPLV